MIFHLFALELINFTELVLKFYLLVVFLATINVISTQTKLTCIVTAMNEERKLLRSRNKNRQ